MPNVLHYRGDVVDELHAQAAQKDLFGPDLCGPADIVYADMPNAFRLGMVSVVRQFITQPMSRGAFYICEGAEYDAETDITTAYFAPYVDPRQRTRYHGGVDDGVIVRQPTVGQHDTIGGR